MENTLAPILGRIISDEPVSPGEGIIHHMEGVDLLPANIELSGLEVTLVNTISRETILREYLNSVRDQYDVILLDCCPSLGMLTINALAAADDILVPMLCADYCYANKIPGKALKYHGCQGKDSHNNSKIVYHGFRGGNAMIQYEKNTQIVVQTLQSYGYSARAVRLTGKCFEQLRHWFLEQEVQVFSESAALNWAKTEITAARESKTFPVAMQCLWDVYEHGKVLRTHIVFYGRSLPESFMEAKKGYAASQEGAMAGRTLGNLSDCCNRFWGFLCINGIRSPADISYHILDRYMFDISQTSRTPCRAEGYVEGLLFYMAELGQCSYGLGWYVHFAHHGKVPLGDDFSLVCVTSPEDYNGKDAAFVLHSIPAFLDILKGYRYSHPVINTSHDVLTLFYVLLDMSGSYYSRTVAETWINAAGKSLFKSSFFMARRALELYDDFLSTGNVDPFKRWKHRTTDLELLPEWCHESIRQFMEQKQREGRRKKTVANYVFSATKFCLFLLERGISDFGKLTSELIKAFNEQDVQTSAARKRTCNSEIRKFLNFLFRQGLLDDPNLYLSLPTCAAKKSILWIY